MADIQSPSVAVGSSHFIRVKGAKEHNLKNISVEIPRDKLTVITGLSGSGKSTLAFDTIFAEGQRKYMESLSAYARQFLDQMQKPDVESIEGLPPTIAIEQRGSSHNPRSTVATTTEIYDYLRVLYARAGSPHCWECGKPIASQSPSQITDAVMSYAPGTKVMVLAPLVRDQKGEHKEIFAAIVKQGFVRARVDGELIEVNDAAKLPSLKKTFKHTIEVVVDRLIIKPEIRTRMAESVETALKLAQGMVIVAVGQSDGKFEDQLFSEKFACADHPMVSLSEMEPRVFSFNSPQGACPTCHGLGTTLEFDHDLIVPDETLSLQTGAIEAWRRNGPRMNIWYARLLRTFCRDYGVGYDVPFKDLPKKARQALMYGTDTVEGDSPIDFEGVIPHLKRRFLNTDSESVKQRLGGYMSEKPCEQCHGARLREESLAVRLFEQGASHKPGKSGGVLKLPGVSINDIARMNVEKALAFFGKLDLTKEGQSIAEPLVKEVVNRLGFLKDVGLGYLSLGRKTSTLSGGEAQRIRLATQVGSKLVGVCYVLDEPTIGLHQRDNDRLINTLLKLRDLGNTVLMVEHDEDCIRAADYLVDIGPGAGAHGGYVIAKGFMPDVLKDDKSRTVKFITGEYEIALPKNRRPVHPDKSCIELKGASENNLKDVNVRVPLGGLICVTGVSGSGKSTLINQTFLPAVKKKVLGSKDKAGAFASVAGTNKIDKVIEIDQSPIGRTPRSNPATYTGVFDEIRKAFAMSKESRVRGYEAGRFSFNVKGGRCEACQGQGTKLIEMHFLPDVFVECEVCKGKRYSEQTLEIRYRGRNIADVLDMTVEEAVSFFENFPAIHRMLKALQDVGLSYVKLGQPSTQLSGGEAQRIKLASELGKNSTGHTLYVLDEPTTGLHFADIQNLMNVVNRLVDLGNTFVVIEHNLDVIKCADWLIDMGPEGGDGGGTIVAQGPPELVAKVEKSFTGKYLAPKLVRKQVDAESDAA
jgi:excinuclease ABC subunit A